MNRIAMEKTTSTPKVVTSFRKKGANVKTIRGTRVSLHNAQLLTSIGSSTLDFFIGGGLPIGTLCLIEEDIHDIASRVILKYYLSEAVVQSHKIFLSSGGKTSSSILLNELPAIRNIEPKQKRKEIVSDDVMKIATQYQNQLPVQDAPLKTSYHNQGFDLSKNMPEEIVKECSIRTWDPFENCDKLEEEMPNFISCPYSHLLENIKQQLIDNDLKIPTKACETIMRIGICSLGSPLWRKGDANSQELQMVRFLYLLKALMRTSYAVAVVTVPSYITKNKSLINRMRQMCDTVVRFESFEGTKLVDHPVFQEYAGLVHTIKLPVLNSCVYPAKATDLAYKIRRKELIVECLHLPPDFEDNPNEITPSGCGTSCGSSKLDY